MLRAMMSAFRTATLHHMQLDASGTHTICSSRPGACTSNSTVFLVSDDEMTPPIERGAVSAGNKSTARKSDISRKVKVAH